MPLLARIKMASAAPEIPNDPETDDYLRTIADRLTGVEVLQAVTAVMYWHRADR